MLQQVDTAILQRFLTAADAAGLTQDTLLIFLLPVGGTLEPARASPREHGIDVSVVGQEAFGSGPTSVQVVVADFRRSLKPDAPTAAEARP